MESSSVAVVTSVDSSFATLSNEILSSLSEAGFEKATLLPADGTLPGCLESFSPSFVLALPSESNGLQVQSLLELLGLPLAGSVPKSLISSCSKRAFLRTIFSKQTPTVDPLTATKSPSALRFCVPLIGNPKVKPLAALPGAPAFGEDGFCDVAPVPLSPESEKALNAAVAESLCSFAKKVFKRAEMVDCGVIEVEISDPSKLDEMAAVSVSCYPCVNVSPFVALPGDKALEEPKSKRARKETPKEETKKMSVSSFVGLVCIAAASRLATKSAAKAKGKACSCASEMSDMDRDISANLALLREIEKDDVVDILSHPPVTDDCVSIRKADVAPEDWNSWRWQLRHRVKTLDQLRKVLKLTPEEEGAFTNGKSRFPISLSPYVVSLIDPNDPHDPVRQEFIPRAAESQREAEDIEDSLGEDEHMPVPGVVHRYPDRVLMLVSMSCAAYCRFCTRNRVVGQKQETMGPSTIHAEYYEKQIAYIRGNPAIRDVLLSGGDPLLIPLPTLDWILSELRSIPHIEVLRIGSRVPITLPQRITPALCNMLRKYHPLWLNTHVNHPNELSPDASRALKLLADAGIPLGCQTVLLAGVNDCPNIQMKLVQKLVENRVRPYYIYQCDLVVGAAHFRTPVSKLMEVIEALRGHTSGFCNPTAVIDAPHGGGKVPIFPNYLISMNETKAVVRNFEGFISTYTGPHSYKSHDPTTCSYCKAASKKEDRQSGIISLLAGKKNTIKPEGWDISHVRPSDGKEE